MDGQGMSEILGKVLIAGASACVIGGAVIGGGGYWAVKKLTSNNDAVVGVRITAEQQTLRKNGALCDADLTKAFEQAVAEFKGGKGENLVINLKLPANPTQNCPRP